MCYRFLFVVLMTGAVDKVTQTENGVKSFNLLSASIFVTAFVTYIRYFCYEQRVYLTYIKALVGVNEAGSTGCRSGPL